MKTAKTAVKKAKTTEGAATSASDPAQPKPKTKARRDKNATRRAKLLAAVPLPAPKVAMKAPMAMKAPTVAMKAPSKAGATAKVKAKAAATIKKKTTVATKATAKVTAKATAKAAAKTTAASAPKPGKFDIEAWMKKWVSPSEAKGVDIRRYFTSRVHHRINTATADAGIPAAVAEKLRELVCARAGELWDLVHPKKVG